MTIQHSRVEALASARELFDFAKSMRTDQGCLGSQAFAIGGESGVAVLSCVDGGTHTEIAKKLKALCEIDQAPYAFLLMEAHVYVGTEVEMSVALHNKKDIADRDGTAEAVVGFLSGPEGDVTLISPLLNGTLQNTIEMESESGSCLEQFLDEDLDATELN